MRLFAVLPILLCFTTPALAHDDWKSDVKKRLEKQRVTLQFNQTSLSDVTSFLRDITQLNFVLDPAANLGKNKVSLRLKNVKLSTALDCIVSTDTKTCYSLANGFIIVTTKERAKCFTEATAPKNSSDDQKKLWASLAKKELTLDFDKTPLSDLVSFLQDLTGENMMISGKTLRAVQVTLRAKKLKLGGLLCFLATAYNFDFAWKSKVLVFQQKPSEKKSSPENMTKRRF